METESFQFTSAGGQQLKGLIWGSPASARASVTLIHGIGEHMARYATLARALNEHQIILVAYDQQGHGQSEGKQGQISSQEDLMADITKCLQLAHELNPRIPQFLYGHSMGALEVLYYSLKEKPAIKGVIATSPPLDTASISPAKRKLISLLKGLLPKLTVKNGLDLSALSHDPASNEAYRVDPLVHPYASIALGSFLSNTPAYVLVHAPEWTLPLYLAHGSDDRICPIAGSEAFLQRLPAGVCTWQRWEGLYHETHNEPQKDAVIARTISWIEEQLA